MAFSDGWDAAIAGFLSDSIPGAEDMKNKNPSHRGRKDVCPKAAAIYDAVMSFEFSDKYMKILEETNADAAEVVRFYSTTPSLLKTAVSPSRRLHLAANDAQLESLAQLVASEEEWGLTVLDTSHYPSE